MVRRVNLPSAEDLFRPTDEQQASAQRTDAVPAVRVVPDGPHSALGAERPGGASGRIRHDEKVTVYVTADELVAIEQARLSLRRDHGLAVDRGRLVREAIHLALDTLAADAEGSDLVRRLADSA